MTLSALQAHNIEKAIIQGRNIEAIKLYREAEHCDLEQAKAAIDAIAADLRQRKPYLFSQQPANDQPGQVSLTRGGAVAAALISTLLVGGALYYFLVQDPPASNPYTAKTPDDASPPSAAAPKALSLPSSIDSRRFAAPLNPDVSDDRFAALYPAKIRSESYVNRKAGSASRRHDDSVLERKIKSARSQQAARRVAPTGAKVHAIPRSSTLPTINGVLAAGEWQDAAVLNRDDDSGNASPTRLYLKVVGDWLLIAGDVPGERSADGYDQLRLYFHAGLLDGLVNERLHIGRGPGVTSIRQTDFYWQGPPPTSDDERWKKYPISDWGLYYYAYGTSSLHSGHRQYEVALHIGEAGLHRGVPFSFYAEVETDPLTNADGKFVERQYLGSFGSPAQPLWLQF
ncbi:hypothetical protein [Spongiibacter sp.]|uniref:hypothetical protein n=1 Tax=Spongiibacter sp. TaxID=2024860 RepID=UPI00356A701C